MPLNLPPVIGGSTPLGNKIPNIGKIGIPNNIGRAQSTAVSSLQQRVDRDNARVSMNQVLSAKAEAMGQKTTSINRIGVGGTTAYSSASRYQKNIKTSVNDENSYDPNATNNKALDDQRYTYVRRLIKARQAKEKALQKASTDGESPLNVGTGHSMHHGGASGFHKQVGKFFRGNRSQFSHLSSNQKAVLEKTIEDRLEHKATGSRITRYDKLAMKKDINAAHNQGKISYRTTKQYKNIVNKLEA